MITPSTFLFKILFRQRLCRTDIRNFCPPTHPTIMSGVTAGAMGDTLKSMCTKLGLDAVFIDWKAELLLPSRSDACVC